MKNTDSKLTSKMLRRTPVAVISILDDHESGENKTRVIKGQYLNAFSIDLAKPLSLLYQDLMNALPLWVSNNTDIIEEQLGADFDKSRIAAAYTGAGLVDIISTNKGSLGQSLGWLTIEDHDPDEYLAHLASENPKSCMLQRLKAFQSVLYSPHNHPRTSTINEAKHPPSRRTPLAVITVGDDKKSRLIKGSYFDAFGIDLRKPLQELYNDLKNALPLWVSQNLDMIQNQLGHDFNLSKIGVSYTTTGLIDVTVWADGAAMTPVDQLASKLDLSQQESNHIGTGVVEVVAVGHGSLGWITIEDQNPVHTCFSDIGINPQAKS